LNQTRFVYFIEFETPIVFREEEFSLKHYNSGDIIQAFPFNFLKPISEEQSRLDYFLPNDSPKGPVLLGVSENSMMHWFTAHVCRCLRWDGCVIWILRQ
jgi:hypothetical protein